MPEKEATFDDNTTIYEFYNQLAHLPEKVID